MGLDGPQLQGIAAIIVALGAAGFFGARGLKKQRQGVPAHEGDIDSNLIEDKRELETLNSELQQKINEEIALRAQMLDAAEQRRLAEARIYQGKIDEVVRQRNKLADNAVRNRRRFIEKYGETELRMFIDVPDFDETWTAAELREFKRLSDGTA